MAADVFDRRWVSNFSKYAGLLEASAGRALGCEAVAVASCDIGMALAWRALGITRGEVIVPSFTLASTVNAVSWNGLRPVFADIDPVTLCVDPAAVRRRVTPDTVGIAGVHLFGEPVSSEVDAIAAEAGVTLLFDAAAAVGTTEGGRSVAGRGDATIFSLGGTKVVTAGEGGIAVFRDPAARERFRLLRVYGFGVDYEVAVPGLNGKISELDAALGHLSFGMLDEMVGRRGQIAAHYRRRLEGRHGIRMQPAPTDGDTRSYKDVVVVFGDAAARSAAEQALTARQVETKRYFLPVHTMRAYQGLARDELPVTEDVWSRALCLPIFHDLSDEQVDRIADVVLAAVTAHT